MRGIFWLAETHTLTERYFFRSNGKCRLFRGSTIVFLVPIDIGLSFTYQNMLVDSVFQALWDVL